MKSLFIVFLAMGLCACQTPLKISKNPIEENKTYSQSSMNSFQEIDSGFRFGLGISKDLSSSVNGVAEGKTNIGGTTVSTSENFSGNGPGSNGIILVAHVRNLPERGLGFISSVEYRLPESSGGNTISAFIPKANIGFRSGQVYGFIGGNLSFYSLEMDRNPAPGFKYRYEGKGGPGFQGGVGFYLSNHFLLEMEFEVLEFGGEYRQTSSSNGEYLQEIWDTYVNNLKMGLKFLF